ncbi:MAG TPA: hypothetical protein DEO85_05460 [Maritimibacter sp.]|nr:hypothetical protein [Maritimibacter sp.]
MRVFVGIIVLIGGIAALAYWGAIDHAVRMENEVRTAADAVAGSTVHPMEVRVSGRDITLSGTADTEDELAGLLTSLNQVNGRRVVRSDEVTVLPVADPYATGLAKGADGSFGMTGTVPTEAAGKTLETAGLTGAEQLSLASGAPDGWSDALVTGHTALGPLDEGSFALSGKTAIFSGVAKTPQEAARAETALADLPDGFETIADITVLDPGVVTFEARYEAAGGLHLDGSVPESIGKDGFAQALGLGGADGDVRTTSATMPILEEALTELKPVMPLLNTLTLRVENGELTNVTASILPGLDETLVASLLATAIGGPVELVDTAFTAENGETRVNTATGRTEVAVNGFWLKTPDFPVSKVTCNDEAAKVQENRSIQFVTGSAELDTTSLDVINDIAGLVLHCTAPFGMNVVIGGHTDSDGDDKANYTLSVARARAVRDALIERGIPASKMVAIGYGETEPVASNDTEEGRAQNRRTTFNWPE